MLLFGGSVESLALVASLVFLSFLLVGPIALAISFSRAPWWFSATLGCVAILMGLGAFTAFGDTFPFIWLGFLDIGCGVLTVYRCLTRSKKVPHE